VARGHRVGIVVDSSTGGERADAALAEIAPRLALGVARFPIHRELSPMDVAGFAKVARHLRQIAPDVLHGHGAKGGAFVRLTPGLPGAIRVYTPHGGSLHYGPRTPRGIVYGALERTLRDRTDLLLFESAFARNTYVARVGEPRGQVRVVYNGVTEEEFVPVPPAPDAVEVAYVGEFRRIKGADIAIDAVALLNQAGRNVRLTLAGDGEETDALHAQVAGLGLTDKVRFIGFVPARTGFAQGQVLVVPSRGDSMPYAVIEAAAAGVPMIAARVGGIPEIFGPQADRLIEPGSPGVLAAAIAAALDDASPLRGATAALRQRVQEHFSQARMVDGVVSAYRETIVIRREKLASS
jgi:glycosyltransferase involved in cell wall biosynthesis